MEWRPIETAPAVGTWCVGRTEGEGRAPAFVGKVYDNPFPDLQGKLCLIDVWTGKWKVVTGWMPLPLSTVTGE